jgi:predicted nucleic acid-binding protein
MIVADTNTIAYLYLHSEKTALAEQLLKTDSHWVAPRLWKSEFRNVLTLYIRKNILSMEDTLIIIQLAETLLLQNEYEVSSSSIMNLVSASNCSAYDCEFVALAKQLDTPLITADKKIIKAFPDIAKTIEDFLI